MVAIYEKALDALPDLWPAANNLAYMLAKNDTEKGSLDRAYELALKAVKLQPGQPVVVDTLGWVHYLRGETDLAITELEKASELAPDSAAICYHLGMALLKANRLDEAREHLEKAASQDDFTEREEAQQALNSMIAG